MKEILHQLVTIGTSETLKILGLGDKLNSWIFTVYQLVQDFETICTKPFTSIWKIRAMNFVVISKAESHGFPPSWKLLDLSDFGSLRSYFRNHAA